MANSHLGTYLNDHLAGSMAALEILSQLEKIESLKEWARRVAAEVRTDRQDLEHLMHRAGIAQSAVRQAAGWMSEKLAELKTFLDDRSGGTFQQLELIEVLALGIDGKRALWTVLQAVSARMPALQGVDYRRLIERAEEQRQVVEVRRLEAALDALLSKTS